MATITNRVQPLLQWWLVSAVGWKYSQRAQICYKSGQTRTLRARLANHYQHPNSGIFPRESGRVAFSVEDAYWQGDKLQIKEVLNANPNSLSPFDTTLDVGWNNMHGYKCESIPAGAYRDFLIRINGTGLTFDDVREMVSLLYPSPA